MGQDSAIEWTDHTFNPWWGCFKVSPGCQHCYADTLAHRFGYTIWGPAATTERRVFGPSHWAEPERWNAQAVAAGVRRRVFCASMADVFEDHPTAEAERPKLWQLIEATPALDWLLLTKRPERMGLAPWPCWPANIWALTSVEDQARAEARIPALLAAPAAVRGLSVEPLLGTVDLTPWLGALDWVIVGGESGPGARPLDPAWVRALRDQCLAAGVPFFFKQWGAWAPDATGQMRKMRKKAAGRTLDGQTWGQFPPTARNR